MHMSNECIISCLLCSPTKESSSNACSLLIGSCNTIAMYGYIYNNMQLNGNGVYIYIYNPARASLNDPLPFVPIFTIQLLGIWSRVHI